MGLGGSNPSPGANQPEPGPSLRTHLPIVLIAISVTILLFSTPIQVHAAPTLSTDQPLYTIRDKLVTFAGSGLSTSQTYYLWIKGPSDNATHYVEESFLPVTGGLVPPDLTYTLYPNATLGTYLASLSTSIKSDTSFAIAHFGVWGTDKPVYQRTQTVTILGGGIFPGTGLRVTIRDPAGNIVDQATLASTNSGDFNVTWIIPQDAITDVFTAFVDGTGVFDNPQQDYVAQAKFTVTAAILSVQIVQQPKPTYQRTNTATVSYMIQYPSGSPVVKLKPNLQVVVLLQDQTTVGYATLTLVDPANGIWNATSKLYPNATPSGKYRFDMAPMAFDDGVGNKGGQVDTISNLFQVQNATLTITSQLNGTQIQIPFGQVSIISKITYPDGTPMSNGTVSVVVSTGSSTSVLPSVYDPTIGAWRSSYSSTIFDLMRVGKWTLYVNATDAWSNSGKATYEVVAQPYLFIVDVAVIVVVILVGRWIVFRFGRRVYFRLRRLVQRARPRIPRRSY